MENKAPLLLTDEQMRKFITEGFLILKTDFSSEFHRQLLEQLNYVFEHEGNPGNNLLPRIRELQQVFDNPIITGALTSVLGPDYMLHAHRHGHFNASSVAGGWHKDSYWGYQKMRNHHPWWAMIMYFPQDTSVQMGPTGVMPGTQNYDTRTFLSDEMHEEALVSGEAGTFALIHYDIWHRSTPNVLGKPRYMLKFEFMRMQASKSPSWDHKEKLWRLPKGFQAPINKQETMWEETWNWLSGQIGSIANTAETDEDTIQQLVAQLKDKSEPIALNASYELARRRTLGIEALLQGIHHDEASVSRISAYGLSVSGAEAVSGLLQALDSNRIEVVVHAVFALGELGGLASRSVPKLISLLEHSSSKVRQALVEALGMIGEPIVEVVASLIQCLQDEDVQVRFNAGLSLSRIGAPAEDAISQLQIALDDENRYVRAHAVEALRYIGTEAAKDALIKHLFSSRWCSNTTPQSTF
jgi:hypothetical protein